MINKIIKTFFKKEVKPSNEIKIKRLGNMYIASQNEKIEVEVKSELHEYFSGFLGLKEIAKIRASHLESVVTNNA